MDFNTIATVAVFLAGGVAQRFAKIGEKQGVQDIGSARMDERLRRVEAEVGKFEEHSEHIAVLRTDFKNLVKTVDNLCQRLDMLLEFARRDALARRSLVNG